MGTNKRYADQIDQAQSRRVDEMIMRDRQPANLKTIELQLDEYALTIPPRPVPVRAWVRYGEVPLLVDAVAVQWTDRVVAVRWETPHGEHKAWVWSSAVERVDNQRPGSD